jgi:hypothetical protein
VSGGGEGISLGPKLRAYTVSKGSSAERRRVLAARLADAGLWAHLPEERQAVEALKVTVGGYPLWSVTEGREVAADGEELAEGGVAEFLESLNPALAPFGVSLAVRGCPDDAGDYAVDINGRMCTVLTRDEAAQARSWFLATVRPLKLVNSLLDEAGADIQVFTLLAGGNDGMAILLDPRVPAALQESGLFDERDVPLLPGEVSPSTHR